MITPPTLDAPTTFVLNVGAHRWRTTPPDSTKPPDRFAPFPGYANYRGGAIYTYAQMKLLKDDYGIRTIINLSLGSQRHLKGDGEFACGGISTPCEPLWAEALGIKYIYVPMTGDWRMTQAKWTLIRDALAEGHAYVHCTHGVDRTGAVVARFRREIDPNVSHDEVMRYTRKFGGAWRVAGDPNAKLRDWVGQAQYDPELAARALAPRTPALLQGEWLVPLAVGGGALLIWGLVYRQRRGI